ncbi:hypothetical protein CEXT_615111 [Caerostris extrusa]|uniref:Uncharacterized protein n=1 Tax=Caerostris extrusa TaxID=172846 RepID=A0AAV4PRI7_CAEEX|nr:hypothetical protein CEXT_615111 [Caerostris extrusa]
MDATPHPAFREVEGALTGLVIDSLLCAAASYKVGDSVSDLWLFSSNPTPTPTDPGGPRIVKGGVCCRKGWGSR